MTERAAEIAAFLAETDWHQAIQTPLAGDASSRRYLRLRQNSGETAILMDAPKESGEDIGPFLHIAQFLTAHDLSSPKIWHFSESRGLILMEDLGDDLFVRAAAEGAADQLTLYRAATDVLVDLHKTVPSKGLSLMDHRTLAEMTEPVFSWYAQKRDPDFFRDFQHKFQAVLEKHLPEPSVLVLRDYHAENLLWLPDRDGTARVGLLDFQDALVGHSAYDLVSMLQDARRDVPEHVVLATKQYYLEKSGADSEDFEIGYSLLGLQRNLRILGIFAKLCLHTGKPHYVDFLPRVHDHVMRNVTHPELSEIAEMLHAVLPAPTPDFLQTLKDQCATHPMP